MKKLFKPLLHVIVYLVILLISIGIVYVLTTPYANEIAAMPETGDGPGVAWMGAVLVIMGNIFLFSPFIASGLYQLFNIVLQKFTKKFNLKFLHRALMVFVVSSTLLAGYFVVSTIQLNNLSNQMQLEQEQLIKEQGDNFFSGIEVTKPTAEEQAFTQNTQQQTAIFTIFFDLGFSVLFGAINVVALGIFEGVDRLIKKLRKK